VHETAGPPPDGGAHALSGGVEAEQEPSHAIVPLFVILQELAPEVQGEPVFAAQPGGGGGGGEHSDAEHWRPGSEGH
jgi:hypothetical protein